MLAQLPVDNVNVQPHVDEITRLLEPEAWQEIDPEKLTRLRQTIAPLLRFLPEVVLPVMTFEVRTERLATAHLAVKAMKSNAYVNKSPAIWPACRSICQWWLLKREKLAWAQSEGFWDASGYCPHYGFAGDFCAH